MKIEVVNLAALSRVFSAGILLLLLREYGFPFISKNVTLQRTVLLVFVLLEIFSMLL